MPRTTEALQRIETHGHMHRHTHRHTHTLTDTHTDTRRHAHTCTDTHAQMHADTHMHMHTHRHICTYMCTQIHAHTDTGPLAQLTLTLTLPLGPQSQEHYRPHQPLFYYGAGLGQALHSQAVSEGAEGGGTQTGPQSDNKLGGKFSGCWAQARAGCQVGPPGPLPAAQLSPPRKAGSRTGRPHAGLQ